MKLNKKEIEAILEGGIEKFKEVVKEKKPEYLEPKIKKGWVILSTSDIIPWEDKESLRNRNLYPTQKDAEMALAMCELMYLRDEANGQAMDEWCDFNDGDKIKYSLGRFKNRIVRESYCNTYNQLTFKTGQIRDKFLEEYEPLIKKAFGL
jgi:hypothetical protein